MWAPEEKPKWEEMGYPARRKAGATNLMLWTMLNLMCFLICILAAVGAAREARAGFLGYALAVGIGLAVGGTSTWAMWNAGERVGAAVQVGREARRELYFRVLDAVAVLWILIALFIADHVTSAAMRFTVGGS
ncbi:MAG: hypothetical protein ACJ71Q_12735 [Terriglobales bacterium]|jgi:predicted ribosomally synthesized peptide with SipW-like signal peptide